MERRSRQCSSFNKERTWGYMSGDDNELDPVDGRTPAVDASPPPYHLASRDRVVLLLNNRSLRYACDEALQRWR